MQCEHGLIICLFRLIKRGLHCDLTFLFFYIFVGRKIIDVMKKALTEDKKKHTDFFNIKMTLDVSITT